MIQVKSADGVCVTKASQDTLSEIEQAQAALRESIEKTKELSADSERLLRQHRIEVAKAKPPNPAG